MGKAKLGVEGFQYAVLGADEFITGDGPVKLPGLSSVKLDITNDVDTFYADDGPYVVIPSGITALSEEVQLMDIPTSARVAILGVKASKGIQVYQKGINPPYVATMFKTPMDDNNFAYFATMKGKFNLPNFEGTTKDDKNAVNQDTITGKFSSRGDDDVMMLIGREDDPDFDLAAFTSAVFPKTAADLAVLHSIVAGTVTQSPK